MLVTGFQGSRVTGVQGSRVPGLQGYRVTGVQGYRVTKVPGLGGRIFRITGAMVSLDEVSLLEKRHAGCLGCSLKQKIHCTSCKVAATVSNILWGICTYIP